MVAAAESATVLVVDDDDLIRRMLESFLQRNSYTSLSVDCAEAALELLAREDMPLPDLVLADGSMPGMSGIELCDQLHKLYPILPVIMVTALDDDASVDEAFAKGAAEYITKPINFAVLRHRISLLLSAAKAERERAKALAELEESTKRYRGLFDLSPDAIVVHDGKTVMYANKTAVQILGADTAQDIENRPVLDIVHNEAQELFLERMHRVLDEGEITPPMEERFQRLDGSLFYAEVTSSPVPIGGRNAVQLIFRDITERRELQEKLRLAGTVFDNTSEAVLVTNAANKIIAVNPSFTNITGYTEDEVQGHDPSMFSSGRHGKDFYDRMWAQLDATGFWEGEVWNRRKGGEFYVQWLSIIVVRNDEGEIEKYIALFSDITQRRRNEEMIRYQANFDALTGLPNRFLFKDRLAEVLSRAKRSHIKSPDHDKVALMFLDLDRFKAVNDTLGHGAGDDLLQEAARRLKLAVRDSDTVSRLGGDEFTVILPDISHPHDVEPIAHKILEQLSLPFHVGGSEPFISGSIGITIYPDDGDSVDELVKNADTAMYQAKEHGRNTFRFFTRSMNQEMIERMRLETDLRLALQGDEFEIHYQPIVNLKTGEATHAEALLRWNKGGNQMIAPGTFIPLAEETGLIVPIGRWVMRSVAQQIVEWTLAGFKVPKVSVNLSAREFNDPGFMAGVAQIVQETHVNTSKMILEVTESFILGDDVESLKKLRSLRHQGFVLAMDDFGTGYSSLSYLKRFPFDLLKIDRSFICDIETNPEDKALTRAIISMAHSLSLKVVGEGVETQDQCDLLQQLRCDYAQGYLMSRPVPVKPFIEYLTANQAANEEPPA